ncbi:MAG: RNA recognition motif domain-containing protein [Roseibacillus sp.]
MKMYVGNIPFSTSDDELKELFGEFGEVTDVHIPEDRESGRPRGFAFVTMDTKDAMVSAIKDLDGAEFGGRNLRVNEAKPREDRGGGGGGGSRGGDRGGRGGDRGNRGGGGGDRW